MANLPIKLLKDEDQNPFIPFVPANAVLLNGSTHNCEEAFANRYTKTEVDAKFAALGTIMEFKGTVPTVGDLPTTATNGDVYLVGTNDPEAFIYIDGEWEDLGKMVDLSAYSTTIEVQSLINSAIATERDNTTVAINNAMNNAVALAKDYTDDEIPTKTSDLVNDDQFITIEQVPEQKKADWNTTDTNDYSFIRNKPTIPSIDGLIQSIVAGDNVTVDDADPANPIISASGSSIIAASSTTAAATAAKVATTTNGGYIPKSGDMIALTLTTANTAANATLNIDGSGAKNIRIGGNNATAAALNNAANGTVYLIYDGTYYNLTGMVRNVDNNDTYSEITEAEITAGTASTARAITARRLKYALDNRLGVYSIQKNGTDGVGIINFKTS